MKTLSALLLFLFLSFAVGAQAAENNARYKQALTCADALEFSQLVALYSDTGSLEKIPLRELLLLCTALDEKGQGVRRFLQERGAGEEMLQFASAYTLLLQGRVRQAEQQFNTLCAGTETARLYGFVGLCESAQYRSDQNALKRCLRRYKAEKREDETLRRAMHHYAVLYAEWRGDMPAAIAELQTMDAAELRADFDLQLTHVAALVYENRLDAALAASDTLLDQYGPLQEALLQKKKLIALQSGRAAAEAFLSSAIATHRNPWQLRMMQKLDSLDPQKEGGAADAAALGKIALSCRHDLATVLNICNVLMAGGFPAEAGQVLNRAFLLPGVDQRDFFLFNLYLAQFFALSGEQEKSRQSLQLAQTQSPDEAPLLWFLYARAMERGELENALEPLSRMLASDPHEVTVLYQRMQLNSELHHWRAVLADAETVLHSRRAIPPATSVEVRALQKAARDQLGEN